MYIDGTLVALLVGVELTGFRTQKPWTPMNYYDPIQILKGPMNWSGTAEKAFVCGSSLDTWLDLFLANCVDYIIDIFPRGLPDCGIKGTMALKTYDILNMEAGSETAIFEGIEFDLYEVEQEDYDMAKEVFIHVTDPDSNIGDYAAITLTDGDDIMIRLTFGVPDSLYSLGHVYVVVVPGGTGNLRYGVDTDWADPCVEDYTANTDSIAATEVAVTQNKVTCIDVTAALTGVALSDVVGLEFTRYGSHGNDTVNADCYYLGVLLTRA